MGDQNHPVMAEKRATTTGLNCIDFSSIEQGLVLQGEIYGCK